MRFLQTYYNFSSTERERRAIAHRVAGFHPPPRLFLLQAVEPSTELDSWQGLGGIADSIVADLAQRIGRVIP